VSTSPTFVARFVDGEMMRMTTHTQLNKLDIACGVRLARHAYRSRTKREPPTIECARFEHNGTTLAEYTAEQIAEIAS